ncbi:MAG: DPP IV N-terminal domain-containing protein [Candidatus Poribacteria bacterium]|nr:DPP IV N-terminal domain-containing protein [Candidatus Poribacteria bacterium]
MVLQRCIFCCLLCLLPTLAHAKIVFKSGSDIYVMDDDGRNAKMLVKKVDGRYLMWPVWSPDGKQIAFLRQQPIVPKQTPTDAIFIINSDGTGEFRVTEGDDDEGIASWSPDGKHLVFTSDRLAKQVRHVNNVWTIDIATKALRRLTRTVSLTAQVAWSPDGKYIAYREGFTINLMRANGDDQRALVPGDRFHWRYSPRWSPDSQSVVYYEVTFNQQGDFVSKKAVIHNIKTGKRRIVQTPDNWSINSACFMGSKHLLISAKGRHGNPDKLEIYRYHLVTGKIVNLTNTPAVDDSQPDWVDDDVLSVSPKDKKSNVGKIKQ